MALNQAAGTHFTRFAKNKYKGKTIYRSILIIYKVATTSQSVWVNSQNLFIHGPKVSRHPFELVNSIYYIITKVH